MAVSIQLHEGAGVWPTPGLVSVRSWPRDIRGRLHLGHQVVVPLAFDLEVGGGAELDGLDQVVGDVGVDAGLQERVERGTGGAAADEPGLETGLAERLQNLPVSQT